MTNKLTTNFVGDDKNFRYSAETTNFGTLPPDIEMGEAAGVAVNNSDLVYVYNRGEHPIIVFDSKGNFKTAWGKGTSVNPHGVAIDLDNNVY